MKILYYGWVRENFDLIIKMKEKYDWYPSIIVGNNTEEHKTNKYFQNAVFLNTLKLRFGEFDYSSLKKIPIGQSEFNKVSPKLLSYLLSFKDSNDHNFSLKQRIYFTKKIFDFWNSVLLANDVDCIIFSTWPHMSSCYSLYLLSKFIFNKKILFLDVHEHLNHSYYGIGKNLENLSEPYIKYLNEKHDLKDVNDYIFSVKKNKDHLKKDHQRFRNSFYQKHLIFKLILKLIISFFKFGIFRKSNQDWKTNTNKFSYKNSSSITEFIFFRLKMAIKTKIIAILYKAKTSQIKSKDYILIAAQYQPEATSVQHVGYYQDIFVMLDLIYSCKDDNTEVYYKEHPDALAPIEHNNTPLYRDKNYWKKITKYKKLKFVDIGTSMQECIKNAKVVATFSSTAGLESLVNEKPILLFGDSFYAECNGVFKIKNYQDCLNAFKKIKLGYKPSLEKVKNYLNSVALSSEKNLQHDKFLKKNKNEIQNYLEKLSNFIYKKYKEYYE